MPQSAMISPVPIDTYDSVPRRKTTSELRLEVRKTLIQIYDLTRISIYEETGCNDKRSNITQEAPSKMSSHSAHNMKTSANNLGKNYDNNDEGSIKLGSCEVSISFMFALQSLFSSASKLI